jgi:hypothetical protein
VALGYQVSEGSSGELGLHAFGIKTWKVSASKWHLFPNHLKSKKVSGSGETSGFSGNFGSIFLESKRSIFWSQNFGDKKVPWNSLDFVPDHSIRQSARHDRMEMKGDGNKRKKQEGATRETGRD